MRLPSFRHAGSMIEVTHPPKDPEFTCPKCGWVSFPIGSTWHTSSSYVRRTNISPVAYVPDGIHQDMLKWTCGDCGYFEHKLCNDIDEEVLKRKKGCKCGRLTAAEQRNETWNEAIDVVKNMPGFRGVGWNEAIEKLKRTQ